MTHSSRYALAGLCKVAQQFSDFKEIAQLVGSDATLLQTIEIARKLSAGKPDLSSSPAPSLPLKSIFCSLKADDKTGYENLYWPALPMAMGENVLFPMPVSELGDAKTRLAALRKQFEDAARSILQQLDRDPSDNDSLLESLLLLMQRFLVPVPASDA
jgi:hypothetical protein